MRILVWWLMSLGLGLTMGAQAAPPSGATLARFRAALVDHAKFQACFSSKVTSGYCTIGSSAGAAARQRSPSELVQRIQRRLTHLSASGTETGALVYHQGEDGALHVFLLDPQGLQIHERVAQPDLSDLRDGLTRRLHVQTRALSRAPVHAKRGLERLSRRQAPVRSLEDVARVVLPGQIASRVTQGSVRRWLVLPWGPIGVMPLSALPRLDGEPLATHASIVVLPDLEALTLPLGRLPNGPSHPEELLQQVFTFDPEPVRRGPRLIVGDPAFPEGGPWTLPPLPGARKEALAVAEVLGEMSVDGPLVGADATHARVIAKLDRMRNRSGVIYLATHGVADPVNPMHGSFLALADQPLMADEIRRRKNSFRQPLVVLSACQSGLGKAFGAGQFGVSRVFYAAGAGQVVGSLWNVDDAATQTLMTRFMAQLMAGRVATEEALRRAMLETRSQFADPSSWASFVVFGNPSGPA
ncbi:MAG: CHAT domain-containing protein [Myxococcota bacterium]